MIKWSELIVICQTFYQQAQAYHKAQFWVRSSSLSTWMMLLNASRLVMAICYADDNTLSSIWSYFGNTENKATLENNMNMELNKISDWLTISL